jgi:stage 0 sporulation protein B (sporulation initiation phosphotransferase)
VKFADHRGITVETDDERNGEGIRMTAKANGQRMKNGNGMEPSEADLQMLRLFNHYRHDWMNDIQILFGYVQLKKYDKLQALMEKIKGKVQQESHMSKLGIPSLIIKLLSFQCEVKELKLEVQMEQEIHLDIYPFADAVEGWINGLLKTFYEEASVRPEEELGLVIRFALEADRLIVSAVYSGGYESTRLQGAAERLEQEHLSSSGASFASLEQAESVEWTASWLT